LFHRFNRQTLRPELHRRNRPVTTGTAGRISTGRIRRLLAFGSPGAVRRFGGSAPPAHLLSHLLSGAEPRRRPGLAGSRAAQVRGRMIGTTVMIGLEPPASAPA
jgi:hypothetical protein